MPTNVTMRKQLGNVDGHKVLLKITKDVSEFEFSSDFLVCLEDEPKAEKYFRT
jgi:hypothetical protein